MDTAGTHRPVVSASHRGTHLSDGCNSRGPPRDSVVATGATPAAATASTLGAAGTETPATQLDAAALDPGSPTSPALTPGSPTSPALTPSPSWHTSPFTQRRCSQHGMRWTATKTHNFTFCVVVFETHVPVLETHVLKTTRFGCVSVRFGFDLDIPYVLRFGCVLCTF